MDQAAGARPRAVPVAGLTVDGTSVPPPAREEATAGSRRSADAGHGLPRSLRRPLATGRVFLRRPTARWRAAPDFLLIGAQRSGTTSLYRYLAAHPAIAPPLRKEIHYFTLHHERGEAWYRAHFPMARHRRRTFEATPYYLFHPAASTRAAASVPDAQIVVALRDPVTRAFSQWQHNASRGLEHLGFEAALDAEDDRLAGEAQRLLTDATYRSDTHRLWSYTARGEYAGQLQRWLAHYPRERLLVLRSEDLYAEPGPTYARVLGFLGLPVVALDDYPRYTRRGSTAQMTDSARQRLSDHFRPHNRRLAELLGEDVWWERG